jgi:hypothetical protein
MGAALRKRGVKTSTPGMRMLGNMAKDLMPSIIGNGDYKVNHATVGGGFKVKDNSFLGASSSQVPKFESMEDGVRVRHREYLGDINTSNIIGGSTTLYAIQPIFLPWLKGIAAQYEQWVPMGWVYEFKSTCGNAVSSTNAALGSISMATQYNVNKASFATKQELLNHYFSVSTKTSESAMHAVECNKQDRPTPILWTEVGPNTGVAVQDPRLSFLGVMQIIAQGSQATYTAGELWVTYDVVFLKERQPSPLDGGRSIREECADMGVTDVPLLELHAPNGAASDPKYELVEAEKPQAMPGLGSMFRKT